MTSNEVKKETKRVIIRMLDEELKFLGDWQIFDKIDKSSCAKLEKELKQMRNKIKKFVAAQ